MIQCEFIPEYENHIKNINKQFETINNVHI